MFSSGTSVSSTNKTDRHDIAEILLKVALNIINQTKPSSVCHGINKMINKKYRTISKFNRIIAEMEVKWIPLTHILMTPNTYIHDPYHIYS
jgi:hypothetical protein